jgi:hypothetical protein
MVLEAQWVLTRVGNVGQVAILSYEGTRGDTHLHTGDVQGAVGH